MNKLQKIIAAGAIALATAMPMKADNKLFSGDIEAGYSPSVIDSGIDLGDNVIEAKANLTVVPIKEDDFKIKGYSNLEYYVPTKRHEAYIPEYIAEHNVIYHDDNTLFKHASGVELSKGPFSLTYERGDAFSHIPDFDFYVISDWPDEREHSVTKYENTTKTSKPKNDTHNSLFFTYNNAYDCPKDTELSLYFGWNPKATQEGYVFSDNSWIAGVKGEQVVFKNESLEARINAEFKSYMEVDSLNGAFDPILQRYDLGAKLKFGDWTLKFIHWCTHRVDSPVQVVIGHNGTYYNDNVMSSTGVSNGPIRITGGGGDEISISYNF
jgi:hypothetical protein